MQELVEKTKISVHIQAAFTCTVCGNEVILIGNEIVAPVVCCNCGQSKFVPHWRQMISTTTKITPLK